MRRYVEPFVGAGSLFFACAPETAVLADANEFLIAAYKAIKANPTLVRRQLKSHISSHSHDYYYSIRDVFNRLEHSSAQSARFIYLNKACFNGIFRVNRKGEFNVPKGSREVLTLPSLATTRAVAKALIKAEIVSADFKETLKGVTSRDFVYLDPPYPALNGTAYFDHYTANRFDSSMQAELAEKVQEVHAAGAKFLMSNADVPLVRNLYLGFHIEEIPVMRYVSANGTRIRTGELLITNY